MQLGWACSPVGSEATPLPNAPILIFSFIYIYPLDLSEDWREARV